MSDKEFAPIQQRLMEFIRLEFRPGYNHYNVSKLLGDASSRQYFRYITDAEESFILAAYPEPFDPDKFSYKQIYDVLTEIGLPVPRILRMDGGLGIVLQEDLGNQTLQRVFLTVSAQERDEWLQRSIDYVVQIQGGGSEAFTPDCEGYGLAFDEEKLNWEFRFFCRHFLGNYRGLQMADEDPLFDEFKRISAELASAPRVLCHRDYHIRNLMVSEGRLYVIDFQDARWGPAAYDLVSLLKDSIELPQESVDRHVDYFLRRSSAGLDRSDFQRQFHLMSIQRLLKALGTYGYQVFVRGNFIYEQYMSGSLHRALQSLIAIPEFPVTRDMVTRELSHRSSL